MNAAWLNDPITQTLEGEADWSRFITRLRSGSPNGDELLREIERLAELGSADRLRGFARAAQKAFERRIN